MYWPDFPELVIAAFCAAEVVKVPAETFNVLPAPTAIGSKFISEIPTLWIDFTQTLIKGALSGYILGCGSAFLIAVFIVLSLLTDPNNRGRIGPASIRTIGPSNERIIGISLHTEYAIDEQ